jgi:uncharacterized protein YndB with AHSA1/START domain
MQPASSANEIVSSRVLATSRERVWRAFADPALLARWWGPRGFTNTFHEFDLRTGGRWRFTMHGPDGAVYEQLREFVAVVAHARIVMDNPNPDHRFRMKIELTAEGAGTRLGWSMVFHDAAEFARVCDIVAAANEENFDRLETVLRDAR